MSTVYVTRYALSQGVQNMEASGISGTMASILLPQGYTDYVYKPHWHLVRSEALARAEEMRTSKIASLKTQLAKLEAMTFEEKEGAEWQPS